jgi:hypothetical protein
METELLKTVELLQNTLIAHATGKPCENSD